MDTIAQRLIAEIRDMRPSEVISPGDQMLSREAGTIGLEHYFGAGRSALVAIATAICARSALPGGDKPIKRILDFGCGHGRVARHLQAAFPNSDIFGMDYLDDGVEWCCRNFGYQRPETGSALTYDLIWAGSVFTHLPKEVAILEIAQLCAMTGEMGVIVFTTQGRFPFKNASRALKDSSAAKFHTYNLSPEDISIVLQGFEKEGFGYVDYPHSPGYGVALIEQCLVRRWVEGCDVEMLSLLSLERGWDAHQDVNAFVRCHLLRDGKGPVQ